MNGTQLRTFLHSLIDGDELDEDFELDLLNGAKEEIESERDWEFLKKLDSSKTSTTSAIDLPTDFYTPIKIYVGNDTQPYYQIPFEQSRIFNGSSRGFYLDQANSKYYLLTPETGTVYFYYIYATPDITSSTSPTFPERFHKLLAYEAAKNFYMADQSERQFNWSPELEAKYQRLKARMVMWDSRLKKRAVENGFNEGDLANGLQYDSNGFYIGDF
jgi:hypothetical protein